MQYSLLYIIGTPIGNLGDISLRALETLKSVDYIVCEDTRVTQKLLARYEIKKPLISFHARSGQRRVLEIIQYLREGKNVAYASDAGTPGISDPGAALVREAVRELSEGVKIVPIPGSCALTAALSISGCNANAFLFLGFPPVKKGRNRFFREMRTYTKTIALYESPHRIMRTLEDIMPIAGEDRPLVVTRELTKQFESVYRGTAREIISLLQKKPIRGEFVIIIGEKRARPQDGRALSAGV